MFVLFNGNTRLCNKWIYWANLYMFVLFNGNTHLCNKWIYWAHLYMFVLSNGCFLVGETRSGHNIIRHCFNLLDRGWLDYEQNKLEESKKFLTSNKKFYFESQIFFLIKSNLISHNFNNPMEKIKISGTMKWRMNNVDVSSEWLTMNKLYVIL